MKALVFGLVVMVVVVAFLSAVWLIGKHGPRHYEENARRQFNREFKKLVKVTQPITDMWWQAKAVPVLRANYPELGLELTKYGDFPATPQAFMVKELHRQASIAAATFIANPLLNKLEQSLTKQIGAHRASFQRAGIEGWLKLLSEQATHNFEVEGLDFQDFREHVRYHRG